MLVASKVAASCKELPTRILLPKLSIGPIVVPLLGLPYRIL